MKKSKIFVLSSLWEEVGFAMVEASINNSYLICSDCPNGPSEFLDNGNSGILFKSNVSGELSKKVDIGLDLISNPNKKSISENNTPIPSPKMNNIETIKGSTEERVEQILKFTNL